MVTEKEQPEDPSPELTANTSGPARAGDALCSEPATPKPQGTAHSPEPGHHGAPVLQRARGEHRLLRMPALPAPTALSTLRQTLPDRASAHSGTPAPAPHPQTQPRAPRDRPTAPDRASPGPGPAAPRTYPPGQRPVPSHGQRRSRRRARFAARPGRPFRTAGPAQRRGPGGGGRGRARLREPPGRPSAPPAALAAADGGFCFSLRSDTNALIQSWNCQG